MTCFWDGLIKALKYEKNDPVELIKHLKKRNRKTKTIKWNNISLSTQLLKENFESIKNYDIKKRFNGYDCSACDPFLMLVSDVFRVDISFMFNGVLIIYQNPKSKTTINVRCSNSHFSL